MNSLNFFYSCALTTMHASTLKQIYLTVGILFTIYVYITHRRIILQSQPHVDEQQPTITPPFTQFTKPHYDVIILFNSKYSNFERRQACRETWLKRISPEARSRVLVRFIFGKINPEPATRARLNHENATHGDLIEVDMPMAEHYRTVVWKVRVIRVMST